MGFRRRPGADGGDPASPEVPLTEQFDLITDGAYDELIRNFLVEMSLYG